MIRCQLSKHCMKSYIRVGVDMLDCITFTSCPNSLEGTLLTHMLGFCAGGDQVPSLSDLQEYAESISNTLAPSIDR